MSKRHTPDEIKKLKRKFYDLIINKKLSQKEAAAKCGISENTATKWKNAMIVPDDNLPIKNKGNSSYTLMEKRELMERLIILLVDEGKKECEIANEMGISKNSICKWVKLLGGMKAIKEKYNDKHLLFSNSAQRLLALVAREKEFAHIYPVLMAAYGKLSRI